MEFLTSAQCRAARGLLDWSQPELAKRCRLHVQTISSFEHGTGSPTKKTLKQIIDTFEREGIEFKENDGVSRKDRDVYVLKGQSGFQVFREDVFETIENGGEIFVSNVQEDYFLKWDGEKANAHMDRMASIPNLTCRFLIEEGDTNTVASHYAEYRQVSKEQFDNLPLYIYGKKTALIVFGKEDVEVFTINHPAITLYFRSRFMEMWKQAKPVQ